MEEIKDIKVLKATDQCANFNEVGSIKLLANNLEIFICQLEELMKSNNFSEARKRHMILPFSVIFMRQTYMVPNKEQTDLITVVKNLVTIERLGLRMSYQDSLLLSNSISFQLEQLKRDKEEPPVESLPKLEAARSETESPDISPRKRNEAAKFEEEKKEEITEIQKKDDRDPEDWINGLEDYRISTQGVEIVIFTFFYI